MKWCCKILKFAPINRLIKKRYGQDTLILSGVRRYESLTRNSYERVQRNEKIPNQILMFPILNWNSFMVWLYLFWRKIPVNEAYLAGRSRIGCWACPERRQKEFKKLERTHPILWSKFKTVLLNYALNNDIKEIDDWIDTGKWRIRASKYKKEYITSSKLCSLYEQRLYKIKDELNINNVIELLKVFGESKEIGKINLIKNHEIEISIISKMYIRVGYPNSSPKVKEKFEHQLNKAINCIHCGACISSCKKGAIIIKNNKISITKECNHCLDCIYSKELRRGCVSLNYKRFLTLVH